MEWLERSIWDLPVNPSVAEKSVKIGCTVHCPFGFWIPTKMEKAPKPFWQPVAVLDHPPSKKSFLLIRWDIMCLNLYPLPLALPLTITEKKLVNSPLLFHLFYVHIDKVPLRLLFFRLNSLSFLSLSLHVRCKSLNHLLVCLLDSFQYAHGSPVLRSPELDTVFPDP